MPFATTSCETDLEAVFNLTERNYAGYAYKRDFIGVAKLEEATAMARQGLAAVHSTVECDALIRSWLDVFGDGHVYLQVPRERRSASGRQPAVSGEPSFAAFGKSAILRLPSFNVARKKQIDALIAAQVTELRQRDVLVIDVRGNSGGGDSSYEALLPFVHTRPIQQKGVDLLATPEIVEGWKLMLTEIPVDEPVVRQRIEALIERLRSASPGTFVTLDADGVKQLNGIEPKPSKVVVVTDGTCASSCEQFVLDARQSEKVTLLGAHTAGVLDYSNVVPFILPSAEKRILALASSRSRRLPEHPVDGTGIVPDVVVPEAMLSTLNDEQLVEKVLQVLAQKH